MKKTKKKIVRKKYSAPTVIRLKEQIGYTTSCFPTGSSPEGGTERCSMGSGAS